MIETFLTSDGLADSSKAALGGLAIGFLFGFLAHRSQFCLRAATQEFWSGQPGERFAVWLLVFGMALLSVQALLLTGNLPTDDIRQLANPGSMSGAILGGLLFGAGMVLARGCASRLLVLSATGNMRAFVTGLLLTVVAQATLTGVLSPVRENLSGLWIVAPELRDMAIHLPSHAGLAFGTASLLAAILIGFRCSADVIKLAYGAAIGLTIGLGWGFTAALSAYAFDPVTIESVSFTGPSANTLMALINNPDVPLNFGIGLVPGVFAGSAVSALTSRTFRIQGFTAETGTARYFVGAIMMGFGGMLAGGCAVGAGVTGGSVLSLTAWVALLAMWLSAGLTHLATRNRPAVDIQINPVSVLH